MTMSSRRLTIRDIKVAVARSCNVSVKDMESRCRNAEFVFARHLTAYLARHLTGKSLQTIGDMLGGLEHGSLRHGIKKIEAQISDGDVVLLERLFALRKDLAA